jgi:hypothetical protein
MLGTEELTVFVSYSQLVVFDCSVDHPFNDWSEKHVAQGFSWRPRSLAFRTLYEAGEHVLMVRLEAQEFDPPRDAARVIDVPFEVPPSGAIEIASISDSVALEIPPGSYQMRFEGYEQSDGEKPKVCFLFYRTDSPCFNIAKADADLNPSADLLLTASVA